jgi:hypothetical protein
MLLLLSPAKTQDFETPSSAPFSEQPHFKKEIEVLTKVLKDYNPEQISDLMKVSEKIAQLNFERYQDFKKSFTEKNSKPAIEAFQGDVYRDIDTENYSAKDFEYINNHVRIISGLYGLLKPLDLMQPYRLEMKTKLKNPKGKDLYEFWGEKLAHVLNKECTTIINLASNEYFKAISKHLTSPLVNISFKEKKNGKLKIIAIYAKLARGTMTNWVVKNRIESPEDLKAFKEDGYKFNPSESSESELVFTR